MSEFDALAYIPLVVDRPDADVVIVGGGPAGLSAALILGRCRRLVVVCDNAKPRNYASHRLNGYLTHDGIDPAELRRVGREQIARYDTVRFLDTHVKDAKAVDGSFEVTFSDASTLGGRKLLIATGMVDVLPAIDGFQALYGISAHHGPYCDGFEARDEPIAIYGKGNAGRGLALELTAWSHDIVLCTDGPAELEPDQIVHLSRNGISLCEDSIAAFEHTAGVLQKIRFVDGSTIDRRVLFFSCGERQRSDLAQKLGCNVSSRNAVKTGRFEKTDSRTVYRRRLCEEPAAHHPRRSARGGGRFCNQFRTFT